MRNLITCLSVCVLSSNATFAETWTVDDDGKADFSTVHEALAAASSGDVILIAPGIYTDTTMYGKRSVLGIASGTITLSALDPTNKPILDGLGSSFGLRYGGSTGHSINLTNIVIRNCSGGYGITGSALHASGNGWPWPNVNVVNCDFENNHVAGWHGAAINCYRANLNAQGSRFINNTGGRAIDTTEANSGGSINATSCYFESNTHGAVLIDGGSHSFNSCVFVNNGSAIEGVGKAISFWCSPVYLYNTQICGNGANPVWTGCCDCGLFVDESTSISENCSDCNNNGQEDLIEVANDLNLDCNSNLILDECELNEITDCNSNGKLDSCDLEEGLSQDVNESGIPDECECLSDIALNDNQVNIHDLLNLIALYGTNSEIADINYDGNVNIHDLLLLIGAWGVCP
jgi:hypothetical protein